MLWERGGRMGGKVISKHSATVADTQVVNTVTEYFQSALFVYHRMALIRVRDYDCTGHP